MAAQAVVSEAAVTTCPCCKQTPRLDKQGRKPERVNGELVFTDWYTLATCTTPGCPLYMVTLDSKVYDRMTPSEGANYLKEK